MQVYEQLPPIETNILFYPRPGEYISQQAPGIGSDVKSSPLGWNDWGTEVLCSSVTPDPLASPLSESKPFLVYSVGQRRTISFRSRSLS